MAKIGNTTQYRISIGVLWLVTLFLIGVANTQAEVTATVDRARIVMGDSLRLTITSDGDENVSDIPMAPLITDFDILQRSTSSSINIVNGRRTHTRQLLIDLSPKREGTLIIPALSAGSDRTAAITIEVLPVPDSVVAGADEIVLFSAELDRDSVYVQGQLLLTLTVQVAVNLDSPSITELKLDNAFVKQLGQDSYQRTIDGRSWRVHEIRYAVFPEQSGTLEIPAQTFAARESVPRRSLFDRGGGRHLRRTTQPLTVEVLPRPQNFNGGTWLPAIDLRVEERWSTPPDQLRAGESTTRTVQIVGHGLQGAQLPPVLFPPVDGLKYYPDQPAIEDREDSDGLIGIRQDSAALVPTRAGKLRIPEIRIPWWNTRTDQLRYAVLPERLLTVGPGEPRTGQQTDPTNVEPASTDATEPSTGEAITVVSPDTGSRVWPLIAGICAFGWLLTLGWMAWSRRSPETAGGTTAIENPSEAAAFKRLIAACIGAHPANTRQGLVDWCAAAHPGRPVYSLDQVQQVMADPRLSELIHELNQHLYGDGSTSWDGTAMAATIKALRQQQRKPNRNQEPALTLYPGAT